MGIYIILKFPNLPATMTSTELSASPAIFCARQRYRPVSVAVTCRISRRPFLSVADGDREPPSFDHSTVIGCVPVARHCIDIVSPGRTV